LSLVGLVISADLDITTITPTGTPGVLDDEIVFGVTNSEDGVIDVSTAAGNGTRLVILEDILISFNGNRNGGVNNSGL